MICISDFAHLYNIVNREISYLLLKNQNKTERMKEKNIPPVNYIFKIKDRLT